MEKFKRMWEIRQEAKNGILEIYIYGDVEAGYWEVNGWDWFWKESENSAAAFRRKLEENQNVSEIRIYINSYGGSVFEGTAIYNLLRRHPARKVVYIDGFACSIASVIAMAGDKIIMPRNTLMMIHNMWMEAVGNAAELRKAADDLDVINTAGRAAYLEKAGEKLNEAELAAMMDAETWLTADRCLELGLCDQIAEREADMTNAVEVLQKVTGNLSQRIDMHTQLAARLRELVTPTQYEEPEPAKNDHPESGPMSNDKTVDPKEDPKEHEKQNMEQKAIEKQSLFGRFSH